MRREPTVDLKPYFLTLNDLAGPLDWKAFFGNDQPVELDVGCGRGLFLFNASSAHPEANYLGLELDYKEGRRAAAPFEAIATERARARRRCPRRFGDAHSQPVGSCCPRLFPRSLVETEAQATAALHR